MEVSRGGRRGNTSICLSLVAYFNLFSLKAALLEREARVKPATNAFSLCHVAADFRPLFFPSVLLNRVEICDGVLEPCLRGQMLFFALKMERNILHVSPPHLPVLRPFTATLGFRAEEVHSLLYQGGLREPRGEYYQALLQLLG